MEKTVEISMIPGTKVKPTQTTSEGLSFAQKLQNPADIKPSSPSLDTNGPPRQPPTETTQSSPAQEQPEGESSVQTEVVNRESLSDEQKIEAAKDQLKKLGMPETELESIGQVLQEAQEFLQDKTPTPKQTETIPSKDKSPFTTKQLAGIGMLVILDIAVNHGHGVSHLLNQAMRHYVDHQVLPGFMEKLGFDKVTIEQLQKRSHELGRGLFQMNRQELLYFLQDLSKHETYELLNSLDEDERNLLIREGTFGNKYNLLSKDEVQKYLIDKLSDEEKRKLKIEIKQ